LPTQGGLSAEVASDVHVDMVETDEYLFIVDYLTSGVEFVEGSTGVKGRLKQRISQLGVSYQCPKVRSRRHIQGL